MNKVLIIAIGDIGNEVEALRQTLETFQCLVLVKYVGRPRDFIDILQGKLPFQADSIIISCHGEDGKIVMPVLGENRLPMCLLKKIAISPRRIMWKAIQH